MNTSHSKVGYRQLTELLSLKFGINAAKNTVRLTLRDVDPDGVEERRGKVIKRRIYKTDGPGEVYHIDGNDKLKRWGFAIHGCVDGFSLKIMWFVVATSNNDPLHKHGFCPKLLRMDPGNENVYCEDLEVFLTGNDDSYLYAASTRNQRIEEFWSGLKIFKTEW